MIRRTLRMLAAALVAAFAVCSVVEAAPPKNIRHRPKPTPRASAGQPATATGTSGQKNPPTVVKRKRVPRKTTARKTTAKSTARAKRPSTTTEHKPATKPR